jgi:hypothetical protein
MSWFGVTTSLPHKANYILKVEEYELIWWNNFITIKTELCCLRVKECWFFRSIHMRLRLCLDSFIQDMKNEIGISNKHSIQMFIYYWNIWIMSYDSYRNEINIYFITHHETLSLTPSVIQTSKHPRQAHCTDEDNKQMSSIMDTTQHTIYATYGTQKNNRVTSSITEGRVQSEGATKHRPKGKGQSEGATKTETRDEAPKWGCHETGTTVQKNKVRVSWNRAHGAKQRLTLPMKWNQFKTAKQSCPLIPS